MNHRIRVPRQKTPYNCGPACLAAAGALLGIEIDEMSAAKEMGTAPDVGTDNTTLAEWATRNLPVRDHGCDTFGDGLSVWNIQNVISGNGHFVLVLGIREDIVRYYDPYWSCIIETPFSSIVFSSGDRKWIRWSLNFDTRHDFFDTGIAPDEPVNPEWGLRSAKKLLG